MGRQAMNFQSLCKRHGWLGHAESYGQAATRATIHRSECHANVATYGVCPNCGQGRVNIFPRRLQAFNVPQAFYDCVNDCAQRGLAPMSGPDTLNL